MTLFGHVVKSWKQLQKEPIEYLYTMSTKTPLTLVTQGLRWQTPEGHEILPDHVRPGADGLVRGAKAVLNFEFVGRPDELTPENLLERMGGFRGPVSVNLETFVAALRSSSPADEQTHTTTASQILPFDAQTLRTAIFESARERQHGTIEMKSLRIPPKLHQRISALATQLGVPVVSLVDGLLTALRQVSPSITIPLSNRLRPSDRVRTDLGLRILNHNADWIRNAAAAAVKLSPDDNRPTKMPEVGLFILLLEAACGLLES